MKRNIVPLLGIAFVVAIAATGIFYGLFVGKINDAKANAPRTSVVVAARAISSGTVLKATDVRLMPWSGSEPIKGALATVGDVVGKTVFSPVDESEPVTQARLATKASSGGINIAQGMRAICVTISESGGILAMLRPGHRVDLQAVTGHQGGEPRIRTILQDIEVLSVNPTEQAQGRPSAPTVTLLVMPRDADQLALADSATKVRLLLRNPTDREKSSRQALLMTNLFLDATAYRPPAVRQAAARPPDPPAAAVSQQKLSLIVKIAAGEPKAMEEMAAKFSFPRQPGWMQVSALHSGVLAEQALMRLEEQHSIEVFSMTRLTTGNNREVSMQTGASYRMAADGAYGLRIQFLPTWNQSGMLRVKVQPEITAPGGASVANRKFETEVELADGQLIVVTGLGSPADSPSLAERLFAGLVKEPANRELFIVATPQVLRPAQTAPHPVAAE